MSVNNLENVADPASSFEESAEPEVEGTPEPKGEDQSAVIARLQTENAALRTVKVEVNNNPPAPVQSQAPVMTHEQLQAQAEAWGFTDPKQLEAISKIASAASLPAFQAAEALKQSTDSLRQELALEKTINRAKKEAQSQDPQFGKLEQYVDEYLDGVSVGDKLDPAKLKGHMERAGFYAKGKMGVAPQKRPNVESQTPRGEENTEDNKLLNKPERWETKDGKIRIDVVPRNSPKVRAMHAHPDIQDAVQIDYRDEWQGPKFGDAK